jgi:hypothetical protein
MAASNTRETAAMTLPLCWLTAIIGEGRAPDKGRAGLEMAIEAKTYFTSKEVAQ